CCHVRVIKDISQLGNGTAGFQFQLAVFKFPSTFETICVFPLFRIPSSWPCFHFVVPHILCSGSIGPSVFARNGACVTTNTFIQMPDHSYLCFNPQANLPPSMLL